MKWNKIEWHELLLSLANLPEVNRRLKLLDEIYDITENKEVVNFTKLSRKIREIKK